MHVNAEKGSVGTEYVFTGQQACNSRDRNMCFGLASCIECLEDGTEKEGMESSASLAARIWSEFSDPNENREFEYFRQLQLQDNERVPIRSKAALEEVGAKVEIK